MAHHPNISRTLEQLEAHPWPNPPEDSTSLVLRCCALRKVPIENLSPADLRVLLSQEVGTKHLMPLLLKTLHADPLADTEYYPGDLLSAALRVREEYWTAHKDERAQLLRVATDVRDELSSTEESARSNRQLLKEVNAFITASDA